jgi:transcriptional regulator with XRE-family HTH domain
VSTTHTERHFPFQENGARIRQARQQAQKSQERLAAEVSTTRRHMIRLENGEHLPSGALRDRIAEATGQPAESLQSADDEDESSMRRSLSDDLHRLAQVASLLEGEAAELAARKRRRWDDRS